MKSRENPGFYGVFFNSRTLLQLFIAPAFDALFWPHPPVTFYPLLPVIVDIAAAGTITPGGNGADAPIGASRSVAFSGFSPLPIYLWLTYAATKAISAK
jgi:hypothetical protein